MTTTDIKIIINDHMLERRIVHLKRINLLFREDGPCNAAEAGLHDDWLTSAGGFEAQAHAERFRVQHADLQISVFVCKEDLVKRTENFHPLRALETDLAGNGAVEVDVYDGTQQTADGDTVDVGNSGNGARLVEEDRNFVAGLAFVGAVEHVAGNGMRNPIPVIDQVCHGIEHDLQRAGLARAGRELERFAQAQGE